MLDNLDYYGKLNLIINGVAILILIGITVYTSLYRKRGKPEDKAYFALIIVNMIIAIVDGLPYLESAAGVDFIDFDKNWPIRLTYTVFFVCMDLYCAFWALYLMFRMKWTGTRLKTGIIVFLLPALILAVVAIANYGSFGVFFKSYKMPGGTYLSLYSLLMYIPIIVYVIFTIIITARLGLRVILLFVPIFTTQCLVEKYMATDITPLFFAVYLIYAHFFAMRDDFYEEVADNADN